MGKRVKLLSMRDKDRIELEDFVRKQVRDIVLEELFFDDTPTLSEQKIINDYDII